MDSDAVAGHAETMPTLQLEVSCSVEGSASIQMALKQPSLLEGLS